MRIYPLNETAITIELGQEISEEVHRRVMSLRDNILNNPPVGLLDIVIAYSTLTIFFDPHVLRKSLRQGETPFNKMERYLSERIEHIKDSVDTTVTNTVVIPVCYDREYALDIDWVASHHSTTPEEIIRRHSSEVYTVFMIGFTPGFPYMGILPSDLESPRKQDPRTHVPAGSVGIAGKQTGIYPFTTPGGWQIIGRTPLKLFNPTSSTPSLLKPGDKVRFEAISKDQFLSA
jgi:inhibitor of KinA